jgi:hypothetical protein
MGELDLEKYRSEAMAEMGVEEEKDESPVEKPTDEPVTEESENSDKTQATESEKSDKTQPTEPDETESEEPEQPDAANDDDDDIENDLEGDLDDYLPPEKPEPAEEPAAEQTGVEESQPTAKELELQAEIDRMKAQAELHDVDLSPPKFELTKEVLEELQDTSPALAAAVVAMKTQMDSLTQPQKPVSKITAADVMEKAISDTPELDFWFNYPVVEGMEPPRAIKSAQAIAVRHDVELSKDPKYSDVRVRLKEVAKRTKSEIENKLKEREKARDKPSLSAAPGSESEGSLVDRISALPASQMFAEIQKLPINQQREVKQQIGMY